MRFSSTLWSVPLLCAALSMIAACGDDDSVKPNDGGTGGAGAGTGGSGGSSSSTIDSGIKPLGDGISGKACKASSDCGGAMCATQITGGALATVTAAGGYCTGPCATNADCGKGGACVGALTGLVNGQCFATCMTDKDCRGDYLCINGLMIAGVVIPSTCRPKPATDQLKDGVAGDACKAAADCPGGMCLTMRGGLLGGGTMLPGGYCSGACLQDADCGSGGVCSPGLLQGMAGECYQNCSSDADCTRDGYRCRSVGQNVRGCNPFADPLPDDTAGKACKADTDCGGVTGTCATTLPPAGFAFGRMIAAPGGYCSQACEVDGDCGAAGVCIGAGFTSGSCFKPCTATSECRTGYVCEQRGMTPAMGDAGMSTPITVCAPDTMPMTMDMDAG